MFGRKRSTAKNSEAVQPVADTAMEALQFLGLQGLPPTPENYALAWHAITDRRGLIAMAVDAVAMEGRTLSSIDVARIMSPPRKLQDEGDDLQRSALRRQTLKLADITAEAVASSSRFERDLTDELSRPEIGRGSVRDAVADMVQRTREAEAELHAASREIENLRQMVEAARDDAQRDALTGLLNRRGALQELNARKINEVGTVAVGDIDHFKSINDRFGHAVGDRVLKAVAASLSEICQVHTVARWGGEEFLFIFDGLSMPHALTLLERARAEVSARTFRIRESDEPIGQVTLSIGAATLRGRTVDAAIEAADRRLYEAKHNGRNQVLHEA